MKEYNDKGQLHGYQQWYNTDGKLDVRVVFKYSKIMGYCETHRHKQTTFIIR